MSTIPKMAVAAHFAADARGRSFPPEVVDAARQCLVDWLGVALGALDDPAALAVIEVARQWRGEGRALALTGERGAPATAALVNGTLAHCLDFDDTHLGSVFHGSGPTWAAALAVGTGCGAGERQILEAFIAGYEIGATIGEGGIGLALSQHGWHATPVLGRFSAAAAAAVLLGLEPLRIGHALGLAATQTGGLTLAFGTMAKPLHSGKAAMDGVLSAELAARGMTGPLRALDDSGTGAIATLRQEEGLLPPLEVLGEVWQLTRNSFKPYAACQLTHAAIDAARRLAPETGGVGIERVRATVNPLAAQLAGAVRPQTPIEGKFSLAWCVALGLTGHAATPADFSPERLADPALRALAERVEVATDEAAERWAACLEVLLVDGTVRIETVETALGSLDHPMGWAELEAKFMALAEPRLGPAAGSLLAAAQRFGEPGSLAGLVEVIERVPLGRAA